MTVTTMTLVSADDRDRVLATFRCTRDCAEHSDRDTGCEWREQFIIYMCAAIGEGQCPWGHGRLTPVDPDHMPRLATAYTCEEDAEPASGGRCVPCGGLYGTPRNGTGWGWWPDLPERFRYR